MEAKIFGHETVTMKLVDCVLLSSPNLMSPYHVLWCCSVTLFSLSPFLAWEIRMYMYACMRVEVVLKHCSGKFRNFYGNVRNECYMEGILFVT